jgi:hypothetical protein
MINLGLHKKLWLHINSILLLSVFFIPIAYATVETFDDLVFPPLGWVSFSSQAINSSWFADCDTNSINDNCVISTDNGYPIFLVIGNEVNLSNLILVNFSEGDSFSYDSGGKQTGFNLNVIEGDSNAVTSGYGDTGPGGGGAPLYQSSGDNAGAENNNSIVTTNANVSGQPSDFLASLLPSSQPNSNEGGNNTSETEENAASAPPMSEDTSEENEVSAPTLPNLGDGVEITKETKIKEININPTVEDATDTTVIFRGGVKTHNQDYQVELTLPYSELSYSEIMEITGEIEVDRAHVGQLADIVVVVVWSSLEESETQLFMLNDQGYIEPWDGNLTSLIAAQQNIRLTSKQDVNIYHGLPIVKGFLQLFFGYRLENGLILFNGEQPIEITIE